MIDWYYVKHRRLEFSRSNSSGNHWLAGTVITIVALRICTLTYASFHDIILYVQSWRSDLSAEGSAYLIFLLCLLLGGMVLLIFSPPKLRYTSYAIWKTRAKDISAGYLLLAPLSPVQLGWSILMLPVIIRLSVYSPWIAVQYILLMLGIQLCTLSIHFLHTRLPIRTITLVCLHAGGALLILYLPDPGVPSVAVSAVFFVISFVTAYAQLNRFQLARGEDTETKHKTSIWEVVTFKESWMQVEWALMTRNKRTRTNLLAGFVSIPFIFFMLSKTEEAVSFTPVILIGIVMTSFVMLQHGLYMIGWEGSYFDLILSRLSLRSFFVFKYRFFVISSVLLFVVCSTVSIWNPSLFLPLLATLMYNIGVNIYIVLQGSLSNTKKLSLNQKTVFNTQAINGTLMFNSLLMVFLPLILLAIGANFFGEVGALFIIIAVGVLGLGLQRPILSRIILQAENKKYSLAKGFRS